MVALVSFDMVNEPTCRSETESCETKVSEVRNDLLSKCLWKVVTACRSCCCDRGGGYAQVFLESGGVGLLELGSDYGVSVCPSPLDNIYYLHQTSFEQHEECHNLVNRPKVF